MKKGFIIDSKSWYAESLGLTEPMLTIGLFNDDGKLCKGEITLKWKVFGTIDAIKLKVYDDAAIVLLGMPELLKLLDESSRCHLKIEKFTERLLNEGYSDFTRYERGEENGM